MTEKTQAIILQVTKYGDGKFMLNTFTSELGRASFSLNAGQNKNRPSPLPCCQSLFQNEIEYAGSNSPVKKIKAIYPSYNYKTIPKDTAKMSVAMFLAEILLKTLTYSECNPGLYEFVSTSLKLLDEDGFKGRNFHLKFLMQLSKYTGFYPVNRYSGLTPCFDIAKSAFESNMTVSKHVIREPYSKIFSEILDKDFAECEAIPLSGNDRSYILEKILDYYRYNFPAVKEIKSLEILQTVFHG